MHIHNRTNTSNPHFHLNYVAGTRFVQHYIHCKKKKNEEESERERRKKIIYLSHWDSIFHSIQLPNWGKWLIRHVWIFNYMLNEVRLQLTKVKLNSMATIFFGVAGFFSALRSASTHDLMRAKVGRRNWQFAQINAMLSTIRSINERSINGLFWWPVANCIKWFYSWLERDLVFVTETFWINLSGQHCWVNKTFEF